MKGLGAKDTKADIFVILLLYIVVAAAVLLLLLLYLLLLRSKTYVQQRVASNGNIYPVGGGLFTKKDKTNVGPSMSPTRLGDFERNPLFFGASSATLNAPSTATVLGRDPDMRRMYPQPPRLPRSRKGEKEPLAAGELHA